MMRCHFLLFLLSITFSYWSAPGQNYAMFFNNDLITLALKFSDFVVTIIGKWICLITGAQGGHERRGSFSGFQSFRRRFSNPSNNYEPLSGEVSWKNLWYNLLAPIQFDLCNHILTQFSYTSLIVFKDPDKPKGGKIDSLMFIFYLNVKIASPYKQIKLQCFWWHYKKNNQHGREKTAGCKKFNA